MPGAGDPFAVSRILAAPDPILFAAHVGAHPADWGGIASLAIETLTAAHLRDVEGGLNVLDVRCPVEAANQLVAVRILPRVEGQAKTALLAALSGPSTIARWAVAVDADVDPSDPRELFWSIASRTHAQSDVAVISGASVPTECLVYADDRGWPAVAGAKWFVDSTIPEVSDPEERSTFERARPRNWATVHLRDFLAPE
ncbi:MAG: UbiD family decarboxylase [Burkholderiales bacterium]|nr:UbiD family decarboxylase [Burkholderiales bacterium]